MSSKPINVEVYAKKDESDERLIKRFLKKIKKEKIIEQYKEHTFYKKPSVKRREKNKKRKRILEKLNQEQQNDILYK